MRVTAFLLLLSALVLPLAHCAAQTQGAKPPRPHIIFILADDMGFHDAPWHNPLVHAPALQGLAEGGITLEQSYMMPVCSPSRAALLSGKYPHTNGMMYKSIKPLQPTGLPLNITLLPETMRGLGYTTHAIGKWHLGFCKDEYTPLRRGFDTFRGFYTGSLDYYSHSRSGKQERSNDTDEDEPERKKSSAHANGFDFRNNAAPDDSKLGQYSTSEFVKNAQTIIRGRDPQVPMFMYLALQNPHGPLQVPRQFLEMYPHETNPKRKVLMGMLSALDAAVESVLDTLKETGHYDNSIVVFSSDNGGSARKMGLNWPLRGTKGSLFEGGTRIPALITSPMISQPGTAYHGIFHATDWYPTLVSAAGGTPPTDLDGIDQWAALRAMQSPPRKQMIYQMISKQSLQAAMRYENYKVIVGNFKDKGWFVPPEFQNIDKELLTNFLDSGKAMNIAPSRPDSGLQRDNSSDADALLYSDVSDMVTAENPNSDYYYYDAENDEDQGEEDAALEELSLNGTIAEVGVSRSRRSSLWGDTADANEQDRPSTRGKLFNDASEDLITQMQEDLPGQDDENLTFGEVQDRKLLEMDKHERRALKRDRKQQKQEAKQQRKQAKLDRKHQKQSQKKLRPMELRSEGIQRVVGNKRRNIDSFDTVASILVSGVPIHLYDLKKDPYERHNIASREPEILEDLLHRLLPEMNHYTPPYDPPLTLRGRPSNFGGFWSSGWC